MQKEGKKEGSHFLEIHFTEKKTKNVVHKEFNFAPFQKLNFKDKWQVWNTET